QHNSPAKMRVDTPMPCSSTVTNKAGVTATVTGTSNKLTASDTATVHILVQSHVTAAAHTIDKNKITLPLTNSGIGAATISSIVLNWPAGDGNLQQIQLGGKIIFNTATATGPITITSFAGLEADRTIGVGISKNLVFVFKNNVVATGYSIDIAFTDGTSLHLTF